MCTVSMIMDYNREKWVPDYPTFYPAPTGGIGIVTDHEAVIEELKKKLETQAGLLDKMREEFEEMKKLLVRAKAYDEKNNEPDCEVDEKVQLMLQIAKLLGVDPGDVLKAHEA